MDFQVSQQKFKGNETKSKINNTLKKNHHNRKYANFERKKKCSIITYSTLNKI